MFRRRRLNLFSLFRLVLLKGQTPDLPAIPERDFSNKKTDHEGALVVVTLLQLDIRYGLSERITLSNVQEASRLPSMEDRGDDDEGHTTGIDENRDEPAEDKAWDFHDLQSGHRWVVPASQTT